jgi:hypothetical protein
MSYRTSVILCPRELTDLLNFVLGLPHKGKVGQVLKPSIHVFVVRTWDDGKKRNHSMLERWCDGALIEAGVMAGPGIKAGRLPSVPPQLQSVLRNFGARI